MTNNITEKELQQICSSYLLQSAIFENESNKERYNGKFILCSTDAIFKDKINLEEIIDNQNKNLHLIPIKYFVIKCNNLPVEKIKSDIISYCFQAEFMKNLYVQNTEINGPDFIQKEDFDRLMSMTLYKNNYSYAIDKRVFIETDIYEQLDFLTPYKKTVKQMEWLNYRNSLKYDFSKSEFLNRLNFIFFKNIQKVSFFVLSQDKESKIININMSENEYKLMKKVLKKYPDVIYYEHSKIKVDERSKEQRKEKIEKDKFVHLQRTISVRECNENTVVSILQAMRYYSKEYCSDFEKSLKTIKNKKDICCEIVPAYVFCAFQKYAEENNLQYTLDSGDYKNATMNSIPIIFLQPDKEKFQICLNTIFVNTEEYIAPTLNDGYHPKKLDEQLFEAERIVNDYELHPVDITEKVKEKYYTR